MEKIVPTYKKKKIYTLVFWCNGNESVARIFPSFLNQLDAVWVSVLDLSEATKTQTELIRALVT